MFFRPAVFLFSLIVGGALAAEAAPLKASYSLADHGKKRQFIVAQDEVHRQGRAQRVAARATVEAVRQAADAAGADLVLYEKGEPHTEGNRRLLTRQIGVRLAPGVAPAPLAAAAGVADRGPVPGAPGWRIFQAQGGAGSALEAGERLRSLPGVLAADPLLARQQTRRTLSLPAGSYYADQWNYHNDGSSHGAAGVDLDLAPVWSQFQGDGLTIGIVDDGLETTHPDLRDNYDASLSYDFDYEDGDPLPPPFDGDDHGTACAGLAAGSGLQGLGIFGVAFHAHLAGLRLISTPTTDAQEAAAFSFHNDLIPIKSNSWGPADNGKIVEGPGPLAAAALAAGVANGRGGLGTIYVWAGGNGAAAGDSSAYDGYASRREVIAAGAIGNNGIKAPYSEAGADLLCVAPSSGGTLDLPTVDRPGDDGYNFNGEKGDYPDRDYTKHFGGTSAAAPQVAGVVALMLQANPQLGWRDVKEILLSTAAKANPSDAGWMTNGGVNRVTLSPFRFNSKYGAGLVDAALAVQVAPTWSNLPPEISLSQEQANLAVAIPDHRPAGTIRTFAFSQTNLRVEQVALTVDVRHALRGQLEFTVTSPMGTVVKVAPTRPHDAHANLQDVTFTTPQFWGETGDGAWAVTVADRVAGTVGVLQRVRLELFGSATSGHAIPAGYAVTADGNSNGFIDPNEAVTVSFTIENNGTQTLRSVTASLLAMTGVTSPSGDRSLGDLPVGGSATASFTFTAQGALGSTIFAPIQLTSGVESVGTVTFPIVLGTVETKTFTSHEAISIPAYPKTSGKSAPYGQTGTVNGTPSGAVIEVAGLPTGAVITKVVLHLDHLRHSNSADLDVLLTSPGGGKMIPMSDVGNYVADDIDLVLDDEADVAMPDGNELFGGRYRPTNFGAPIDTFPAPAPKRPYGSNFAVFQGENPNGTWQLFIRDDAAGHVGGLGSWSLDLSYAF